MPKHWLRAGPGRPEDRVWPRQFPGVTVLSVRAGLEFGDFLGRGSLGAVFPHPAEFFFLGIEITKAIDALELLLPDGIRKSEQDQHKAQLLD